MQNQPWTMAVGIPGCSKELKEYYEKGVLDFVTGAVRLTPESWKSWLAEFDNMGGLDWENRCKIQVESSNLLMDDNKVND